MAGLIKREDVDAVREKAHIEEIVGDQVTLRPAGVGSMKGLCPFHDERSPSFHVRPQVGRWHCFGCNEGGDVISFVQKIDGLGFSEAVEYLAGRVGIQLRYEEGTGPRRTEEPGTRQKLLEAHRIAGAYFMEQLLTPEGAIGRTFLAERSFDRGDAEHFGVGYAPNGWDHLLRHLRGRGFTEPELTATGLMSQGSRGLYDRFRGRLMWPIRDVTGETIGFGARKLHEDDQGPKYLNTPETALYKKSQVLYGIDLAKRDIAKNKQIVVVEGYTDVMAAHLSGVTTAVATCGTAFGTDHVRFVRRLLGDTSAGGGVKLAGGGSSGGEIIFTFDGDAAGQKAAMRAFGEDQKFYAQTFVAVEPSGMDPCELRQARGPQAVQALVDGRQPLFEFVIRTTLATYDLETAEGRVSALRAAAPVVAGIRDTALRPEYARMLAGWLGMDGESVRRAVHDAGRASGGATGSSSGGAPQRSAGDRTTRADRSGAPDRGQVPGAGGGGGAPSRPSQDDPIARLERQTLEAILQHPHLVPAQQLDELPGDAFTVPAWRAVHEAIRAAGGLQTAGQRGASEWVGLVSEEAAGPVVQLVNELSVAPMPEDRPGAIEDYVRGVVGAFLELGLTRKIGNAKSKLQRIDPTAEPDAYQQAFADLMTLEHERRVLRDRDS
ncbi:DNA primase [Sanguibacter antarcticus]|uniref:DNA primase n=1 Tax=Sanguibacter antarcticus TaxID=372484 RepID=A0A2A9E3Q7_9MICO|nr:DNA primase [Sanguibacter antarcticus]PFG32829.1 DNA primase [Sanguibacter antarcticus]